MPTDLLIRGAERLGAAIYPDNDDDQTAPPRADETTAPVPGDPVLLVGGLGTTAPVLVPMTRWLTGLGYDPVPLAIGAGLDCGQRSVEALTAEIHASAERAGRPVRLLGHSRGGQFARAAGAQAPDHVAGLVTLGSPFDLFGLRFPTLAAGAALTMAGTVGAPRMATLSCLFGACCRGFRNQLRSPWPDRTPFTSIYSRSDRVVPAQASIDDSAHNIEVTGGHNALLTGPGAHAAIADALAHSAGSSRSLQERAG